MSEQLLSAPSIIINNNPYKIVPNTLKYDAGEGEITVKAASTGGGGSTTVHAINAETQISKVMFEVFLTDDLDTDISEWKANIGQNRIEFAQQTRTGDLIYRAFSGLSLAPSIERSASADGTTPLEFHGDQMSAV